MPTPSFDLIDIIKTISRRKLFIIIVTVIATIMGTIVFSIKKKKFKADARFLVANPIYGDRNNLFRSNETRYVDYFGGDDDLDRVTSLISSDTVKDRIIRNCQFQTIYNADINDVKGHGYLMSIFNKNFSIKRTEYKDMIVSYISDDPQTAANVANMSVSVLEETFRQYYTNMKDSICLAINNKVKQIDSSINLLTDSLAIIRDRSGIYSILSPQRQNVITGDVKSAAKGLGKAVEQIQNVESVKDQLVTDKAHYLSLLNEFSVSTNSSMRYLKLITRALPPATPNGPGLLMTVIISASLGLFFSMIFVLLMAYYRLLISYER